jgi:hypothetical protein
MASGHVNRIKRPNTWLHRPMLQNVKKALANTEPSTHGTFRICREARQLRRIAHVKRLIPATVRAWAHLRPVLAPRSQGSISDASIVGKNMDLLNPKTVSVRAPFEIGQA